MHTLVHESFDRINGFNVNSLIPFFLGSKLKGNWSNSGL